MKTTSKTKNTSPSNSQSSKPFFNKSGEGTFFSSTKEIEPPFFKMPMVQTKLTIGQTGDKYEQEADIIAERVVQKPGYFNPTSVIQNKCEECSENEEIKKAEEQGLVINKKPIFESSDRLNNKLIQGKGINNVAPKFETQLQNSMGNGQPLEKRTRQNMEQSFGADFTGVKVHTDKNAIQMNQKLGAQAFTTGSGIYFNKGNYSPNTQEGKTLLAHELTHVIQQNGISQKIQRRGEEFGQSSTGITRHLISDLSSPITVGSEPRFELIQHGSELWGADTEITYRWTITDLASGSIVFQATTSEPENRIRASVPGNYEVNVSVLGNGNPSGTSISMNQEVVTEDGFLTTNLSSSSPGEARTYRELINDFKTYIIDAANATGPNGITPLFLASVLFIEVLNRPKEGRESEIEGVGEAIGELQRGSWLYPWQIVDRSIGVGQIRLSTAAMVTGATPWVDQERGNREPGREQTEENFEALSADEKAAIFQLLRWPESNISMAARLLTTLKNRANRFPTLTKGAFSTNQHAVGVVASEYNLGPSDTSAVDAGASWYGQHVWNSMNTDAILIHYFPNS